MFYHFSLVYGKWLELLLEFVPLSTMELQMHIKKNPFRSFTKKCRNILNYNQNAGKMEKSQLKQFQQIFTMWFDFTKNVRKTLKNKWRR